MPRTNQGLSNDLIDLYTETLLPWWQERNCRKSKAQIQSALNTPEATARRTINEWVKHDLIEQDFDAEKKNVKKFYKLPINPQELAKDIRDRGEPNILPEVNMSPPVTACQTPPEQPDASPIQRLQAACQQRSGNVHTGNCIEELEFE